MGAWETDDVLIAAGVFVVVLWFVVTGWFGVTAWDLRQKNDGLRNERDEARWKAAMSYKEGYHDALETSTPLLSEALTRTVTDVTKALVGEMIGEPGKEVVSKPVTDQTPEPSWFEWDDPNKPVEDVGVGDSVYVPRDYDDRVASIAEGESIIPGVPLPDMSGEKFDG